MTQARAICDVVGIVPADESAQFGPFLPPVVQIPVDAQLALPGMELDVTIRIRIRTIVPGPFPAV